MRRDVLRVGIGRLVFEMALGVVLALPSDERERMFAMIAALASALVAHAMLHASSRRAFAAAHLALVGSALAAHVPRAVASVLLAAALGAAIELTHVDLVRRRRLTEHVSSLRIPSSLLVRRLGSGVIVAIAGRASLSVAPLGAHPSGLAPLVLDVGALAILAAGFGAGPGRPETRPFDALVLVLAGVALALRTS